MCSELGSKTNWSELDRGESRENATATRTFQGILPVVIPVVCVGVIGNLVVVHAVLAVSRFRQSGNFMLANLSLTSLLGMAVVVFYALQQQEDPLVPFSPWFCRVFPGIGAIPATAEGFSMVCLSLDRTRMARKPLACQSRGESVKKIVLIWTAALAMDLPKGFLFWSYDESLAREERKCMNRKELIGQQWPYVLYLIVYLIVASVAPCMILLRDLVRMTRKLRFMLASKAFVIGGKYQRNRLKLIRNALVFTGIFILAKIPEGIYSMLLSFPENLLPEETYTRVRSWRRLYYSVAALRFFFYPVIIFALSTELRQHLFCCSRRRRRDARHHDEG